MSAMSACAPMPPSPGADASPVASSPAPAPAFTPAPAAPRPGEVAVSGGYRGGCFGSQLRAAPWADDAADSVVQVVSLDGRGGAGARRWWTGTGFVVRGSAGEGEAHNRILTAGHVAETASGPNGAIGVLSSSGALIGRAEVVARAAPGAVETARDGTPLSRGDLAVLRLREFWGAGEADYASVRGVEIAPSQSARMLRGLFERPAGFDGGVSGAPALDRGGRAVGVAVRTGDAGDGGPAMPRRRVEGGTSVWNAVWGRFVLASKQVALPPRSWGFVEPIADPAILAALGRAGARVDAAAGADPGEVQIPGFPLDTCVVFEAALEQAR